MEKNELIPAPACVVIGGSAGSLKVLLRILPGLDPHLLSPIIIVLHRQNGHHSTLAQLLGERCRLIVKEAEDKETLLNGIVYLAPADYHLLVEKDYSLSLDGSEKIRWSRPSIDVTFQSVAEVFGAKTLGILLSGANDDGASGLVDIQLAGGTIIIQDPLNAEMPVMPLAALNLLQPDFLLPDHALAATINNFG